MVIKKSNQREAMLANDSTGLIEVGLELIDEWVARQAKPWLSTLWTWIRAALRGSMNLEMEAEADDPRIEAVTSVDALLEFVLSFVDKAIEESGRPVLKMLWRLLRPHLVPKTIALGLETPDVPAAPLP